MGKKLTRYVTTTDASGAMVTLPPGTEVSGDVEKAITNPDAFLTDEEVAARKAGGTGSSASAEPITADYADRKGPELQAEIARRNAERPEADAIVADGKSKAAFVAALEADDAASA